MKKLLLATAISIATAAPAFAWFGGELVLHEYYYNPTTGWYIAYSAEKGTYSTFEACEIVAAKGNAALGSRLWTPKMPPPTPTTPVPFAYTCVPFIPAD